MKVPGCHKQLTKPGLIVTSYRKRHAASFHRMEDKNNIAASIWPAALYGCETSFHRIEDKKNITSSIWPVTLNDNGLL